MRTPFLIAVLLAACAPTPEPNQRGVGFGTAEDFAADRARRDAALSGEPLTVGPRVGEETRSASTVPLPEITPAGDAVTTAYGGAAAPAAPVDLNNPGISDEQNFDAVADRETIESDAERIARQRQARLVIEPEELPERPRGTGPNIVEYALQTANAVGEPVHGRRSSVGEARHQRACARYTSDDLAQEAFLEAGGPERDRKGLDPDGDGFACAWDPAPFRAARR